MKDCLREDFFGEICRSLPESQGGFCIIENVILTEKDRDKLIFLKENLLKNPGCVFQDKYLLMLEEKIDARGAG